MHNHEGPFSQVPFFYVGLKLFNLPLLLPRRMESIQLNPNGDHIEDASHGYSLSPETPDMCNFFGDPEILPRLGDEYQAEIPPIMIGSGSFYSTNYSIDVEPVVSASHAFLVGLPIPVMWINEELKTIKHEGDLNDVSCENGPVMSECIGETQIYSKEGESKVKVEDLGVTLDVVGCIRSENLNMQGGIKNEKHCKYEGKGFRFCPVPDSMSESWSEIEEASFLLGLYIFGKNLSQVKKLIESKNMGDILSFYYGKFYRSEKYLRWSSCRKMRSRRCIYGQRIFTGLRQQEFLSRLLPYLSEERQNALSEVSKTFGEGKILLEEYVMTLKSIVGMNIFIEAVGIGKGKQDLTGVAIEPLKSNHVLPARPDIPSGKACSSLTPQEIIKFLTGDFRLSKARSNDLFWEAVWPLLLARGWHSEQPKNYTYATGPNHSLVFLIPGVKKFSRRKLVKGNHYFDSITDVLSKVASDPGLLELEIEADLGNQSKGEFEWTNETKLDQDTLPEMQRHCYLQPRTPNRHTDGMKFTVVDTSLIGEGKLKVRELRSLPFEASNISDSISRSKEIHDYSFGDSTDESNSSDGLSYNVKDYNNSKPTVKMSDEGVSSVWKEFEVSSLHGEFAVNSSNSVDVSAKGSKNEKTNVLNDEQPRKDKKSHSSQRRNLDNSKCMAPVPKRRRRLSACSRAETSHGTISISVGSRLKLKKASCCSDNPDTSENALSEVDLSQEKVSSTSFSSKGSPVSEGTLSNGAEHPPEKPHPQTLIDLNLPDVSPDFDINKPIISELAQSPDDQTKKQHDDPNQPTTSMGSVSTSEHQPNTNSRRQSTRNRPLTTKALEAFAYGFLSMKPKRKSTEALPQESPTPRPPRRARKSVVVSKLKEGGIDKPNSNDDMFNNFQVETPVPGP